MYIALNPTLVTGRAGWPRLAEIAAESGYSGVDVPVGPSISAPETHDLLARLRLKPAVVAFPVEFRKDDALFEAGLKMLPAAARFASDIGCPRMATWILPSSERPKAEQRAVYQKRLSACARVLGDAGVRLGLEFVSPVHLRKRFPHEFIWSMAEMLQLARDCGRNTGLLLDCWHWHHAGGTVAEIVKAGRDAIVHVHLNDAAAQPPEKVLDGERLMPGEGVIDLNGFLGALKKIGYADAVSVEVFGRGLKDMSPEAAAKLGRTTAEAVFRRAGIA